MTRLILDTNIIISSILSKGFPYFIVQLAINRKVELILSPDLLEEYKVTILRPKFKKVCDEGQAIIDKLSEISVMVEPKEKVEYIKTDLEDNQVLECALEGTADYIITGNKKDFTFEEYKGIKVVSPQEFIADWGSRILG